MGASTNFDGNKYPSWKYITFRRIKITSAEVSMEICGNFHASRANGSPWIRTEDMWKPLEVYDIGRNIYGYIEAHESLHGIYLWTLMDAMEASTSPDSGNFHVFPWKLPLSSMEVYLLGPTPMDASMQANLLPSTPIQASLDALWQLSSVETSIGVGGNFHPRNRRKKWKPMAGPTRRRPVILVYLISVWDFKTMIYSELL